MSEIDRILGKRPDGFGVYGEKDDSYKPYDIDGRDRGVLEITINKRDGGAFVFPYSFKGTTRLDIREGADGRVFHAVSLTGGGVSLIIYMLNFEKLEIKKFLGHLAKHSITEITEYPDDTEKANEPIIYLIEEV